MKRRTAYATVFLGAVLIWGVGLGCWPLLVWSPLNCTCEDIDINSGRIRYRRYLAGLCVYTSVKETRLSRILSESTDVGSADWHVANTFSPLVHHSPHHMYHGAIHQVHQIETIWDLYSFTPAAKQQMARDVVSLWHSDEGYHPVNYYLNELESGASGRQDTTIDAKDLPTIEAISRRRSNLQASNSTM